MIRQQVTSVLVQHVPRVRFACFTAKYCRLQNVALWWCFCYFFFFFWVTRMHLCVWGRDQTHLWSGWRSRGRWDTPGPRGSSCVLKGLEECHHRQTRCELWNNRRTTEINTACSCDPAQKKSQSKITKGEWAREARRGVEKHYQRIAQSGFNVMSQQRYLIWSAVCNELM